MVMPDDDQTAALAVRACKKLQETGAVTALSNAELAVLLQQRARNVWRAIGALDCVGDPPEWTEYELRVRGADALLWEDAARRLAAL